VGDVAGNLGARGPVLVVGIAKLAGSTSEAGGAGTGQGTIRITRDSDRLVVTISGAVVEAVAVGVGRLIVTSGAGAAVIRGIELAGTQGAVGTGPLVAAGTGAARIAVSGHACGLAGTIGVSGARQVTARVAVVASGAGATVRVGKASHTAAGAAIHQSAVDAIRVSIAVVGDVAGNLGARGPVLVVGITKLAGSTSEAGGTGALAVSVDQVTGNRTVVLARVRAGHLVGAGSAFPVASASTPTIAVNFGGCTAVLARGTADGGSTARSEGRGQAGVGSAAHSSRRNISAFAVKIKITLRRTELYLTDQGRQTAQIDRLNLG